MAHQVLYCGLNLGQVLEGLLYATFAATSSKGNFLCSLAFTEKQAKNNTCYIFNAKSSSNYITKENYISNERERIKLQPEKSFGL